MSTQQKKDTEEAVKPFDLDLCVIHNKGKCNGYSLLQTGWT